MHDTSEVVCINQSSIFKHIIIWPTSYL